MSLKGISRERGSTGDERVEGMGGMIDVFEKNCETPLDKRWRVVDAARLRHRRMTSAVVGIIMIGARGVQAELLELAFGAHVLLPVLSCYFADATVELR